MEGRRRGRGVTHIAEPRIIIEEKCPNWQAAGRATALLWYPTPCPSPP